MSLGQGPMDISVYVPCYNGTAWLGTCLESLLDQALRPDEVIVVDDGSTDESTSIARSYGTRVRLVQHDGNRGLAAARNTALRTAAHELVASVDADVRADPCWLARLAGALHSSRTVAVGGKLVEAHQERPADRWRAAHMRQHSGDQPLVNPPVLPGANTLVRRRIVLDLGGYDETLRANYEDVDLQHRLLAAGYRCGYEPSALAWHLRTDTARTVLRTYWNWLRHPFERQGQFGGYGDLIELARANALLARESLWQDFSSGAPSLAYLSLLVVLVYPAADCSYAACRAHAAGAPAQVAELVAAAHAWPHLAARALANHSSYLASHVSEDVSRLAWWAEGERAPTLGGPLPFTDKLAATVGTTFQALPRAWWPALEQARHQLALEESWTESAPRRVLYFSTGEAAWPAPAPTSSSAERPLLSEPAVRTPRGIRRPRSVPTPVSPPQRPAGSGSGPAPVRTLPRQPRKILVPLGAALRALRLYGERVPELAPSAPEAAVDRCRSQVSWLVRSAPDLLAILLHGAAGRGESLPGAPLEWLLVVRQFAPDTCTDALASTLSHRLGGVRIRCGAIEAHRLGWLPPSTLQQSLLAGAALLWGDPAILTVIPSWRPDQLDPRLALTEQAAAEAELASGWATLAVQQSIGALLIARRAYTPRFDERRTALQRAWPELSPYVDGTSAQFLEHARVLLHQWLFAWTDHQPAQRIIQQYQHLRTAALAAAAR